MADIVNGYRSFPANGICMCWEVEILIKYNTQVSDFAGNINAGYSNHKTIKSVGLNRFQRKFKNFSFSRVTHQFVVSVQGKCVTETHTNGRNGWEWIFRIHDNVELCVVSITMVMVTLVHSEFHTRLDI